MTGNPPFLWFGRWSPPNTPAWLRPPRIIPPKAIDVDQRRRPPGILSVLSGFIGGNIEPKSDWETGPCSENEGDDGPAMLGRSLQAFDTGLTPEICLFGFEIEELPEFVSGANVTSQKLPEKIHEVLQQWALIVGEMHAWQAAGFSIRMLNNPDAGRVRIAVIGRVVGGAADIEARAQGAAGKLGEILDRMGLRGRALGNDGEMSTFLDPFPSGTLCEVRQFDSLMELNDAGMRTDNYFVTPFERALGTWTNIFDAMIRQNEPVMVNLHMEPTESLPEESTYFSQAADYAKSIEQFEFRGNRTYIKEHSANACIIAKLYTDLQLRLHRPFVATVQVTGMNPSTVAGIAAVIESSLSESASSSDKEKSMTRLPPRALRCAPGSKNDLMAARCTLTNLVLTDWLAPGQPIPSLPCQRLRYLMDADGASAVFRFPIATGAGIAGVKTFRPKVGYETGHRKAERAPDHVSLGNQDNGGVISVPLRSLTRHMLIAGIPGSGKTNTSLGLLAQLWRDHQIPFLVIEPIKQEYRGLASVAGFEQLQVFTLGDERTSPFRINPLELQDEVSVEEHIGGLLACFRAAMPQDGPLPMLIEESIRGAYSKYRWRSTDIAPVPNRDVPMLRDVYDFAVRAVETKGYAGDIKQNIMGALKTRLGSLLLGTKGRMFNCDKGIPVAEWMTVPTVFEFERIRDPEQKSLPILFLILMMREYCRTRARKSGNVTHVTLIEEAHNVMPAPSGSVDRTLAADTTGQASKDIGNMLHEMRGLGEGIFVAEQTPTLLNRAAIDLTMTKLVHRLSSPKECEVLGGAMIMDAQQHKSLQNLRTGEAAVFAEGLEGATYVTVQNFKDNEVGFSEQFTDSNLKRHMQPFAMKHGATILPFDGCRFCSCKCKFRNAAAQAVTSALSDSLRDVAKLAESVVKDNKGAARYRTDQFYQVLVDATLRAGLPKHGGAVWCVYTQVVDEEHAFTPAQRTEFHEFCVNLKNLEL